MLSQVCRTVPAVLMKDSEEHDWQGAALGDLAGERGTKD